MIEFHVWGKPETKGSWRVFMRRGRPVLVPDNEAEPAWAQLVAWSARAFLRNVIEPDKATRYVVSLEFVLPPPPSKRRTNRRDLDKLARSILDALTGIVWADDEQVEHLDLDKTTGPTPGVRVKISPRVTPAL